MDIKSSRILIPEKLKDSKFFKGGFTTPLLGNQSFYRPLVSEEVTRQNRKDLAELLEIDGDAIVSPHLIHSNKVLLVDSQDRGKGALSPENSIGEADGLITKSRHVFLLTTAADCVPILIWDRHAKVCASVHAGRKGLVQGVLTNTIKRIQETFENKLENIEVAIGPCIKQCCYCVDKTTANSFGDALDSKFIHEKDNLFYLDLLAGTVYQLKQAGVLSQNIEAIGHCTFCHPHIYYSARREGNEYFQTLAAVIGVCSE